MRLIWIPEWNNKKAIMLDVWVNPEYVKGVIAIDRQMQYSKVRATIVLNDDTTIDTPVPAEELVPYLVQHSSSAINPAFANYRNQ